MVNTKILLAVVIVLLIGVAAAGYQITNNNGQLFTPTTTQQSSSSDQVNNQPTASQSSGSSQGTSSGLSTSGNGGTNVKISSAQAKLIASQSIEQQGAYASTPKLTTINGKKVYVVPIIYNGKTSGEIWIDANTGSNVGGAGGAP